MKIGDGVRFTFGVIFAFMIIAGVTCGACVTCGVGTATLGAVAHKEAREAAQDAGAHSPPAKR